MCVDCAICSHTLLNTARAIIAHQHFQQVKSGHYCTLACVVCQFSALLYIRCFSMSIQAVIAHQLFQYVASCPSGTLVLFFSMSIQAIIAHELFWHVNSGHYCTLALLVCQFRPLFYLGPNGFRKHPGAHLFMISRAAGANVSQFICVFCQLLAHMFS